MEGKITCLTVFSLKYVIHEYAKVLINKINKYTIYFSLHNIVYTVFVLKLHANVLKLSCISTKILNKSPIADGHIFLTQYCKNQN